MMVWVYFLSFIFVLGMAINVSRKEEQDLIRFQMKLEEELAEKKRLKEESKKKKKKNTKGSKKKKIIKESAPVLEVEEVIEKKD